MTREDFNKYSFGAGEMFSYDGWIYDVVSVDFAEGLLGLNMYNDTSDLSWVRCESGEIIKPKQ